MCPAFSYRVLVQQSSRDQHINPSLSFSLRWASESGMQECAPLGGSEEEEEEEEGVLRVPVVSPSRLIHIISNCTWAKAWKQHRDFCFFTRCVYSCFLCNFAVLSPRLKWTRWCVSSRALWARLSLCSCCRSVSPALLVRRRASSHQCITALTDTLACFTAKKEVEMSLFVPAHSWHCLLRCNLFRLN